MKLTDGSNLACAIDKVGISYNDPFGHAPIFWSLNLNLLILQTFPACPSPWNKAEKLHSYMSARIHAPVPPWTAVTCMPYEVLFFLKGILQVDHKTTYFLTHVCVQEQNLYSRKDKPYFPIILMPKQISQFLINSNWLPHMLLSYLPGGDRCSKAPSIFSTLCKC